MSAGNPWDEDSGRHDPDAFGDTYYEGEHYGPDEAVEHYLDEPSRCAECERPMDSNRERCEECEHDQLLGNQHPDAYEPVHEDVAIAYETQIGGLSFAVVPARSRYEAIVRATFAFDEREPETGLPAGYEGRTFELVHEANEDEILPYTIGWGALPDAVPVACKRGLKLFRKAYNRTDWHDALPEDGAGDHDRDLETFLYSQDGTGICRASQFVELINGYEVPDDPRDCIKLEYGSEEEELWIVPAFDLRITPTVAF